MADQEVNATGWYTWIVTGDIAVTHGALLPRRDAAQGSAQARAFPARWRSPEQVHDYAAALKEEEAGMAEMSEKFIASGAEVYVEEE